MTLAWSVCFVHFVMLVAVRADFASGEPSISVSPGNALLASSTMMQGILLRRTLLRMKLFTTGYHSAVNVLDARFVPKKISWELDHCNPQLC